MSRTRIALAIALSASVLLLSACSPASDAPRSSAAAASDAAPGAAATDAAGSDGDAGTPTPTPTVDPLAVATRTSAQEGLAIALASNVLHTQLLLVSSAYSDDSGCTALDGGGSVKRGHRTTSGSTVDVTNHIYYDRRCATPYIVQKAHITEKSDDTYLATATEAYTAADGTALGTLTTDARATIGSGIRLEGLGTFTPATGAGAVSLGLACSGSSDTHLDCQGGITQDFAALGTALGSVTPLALELGGEASDTLEFSGTSLTTATGPLGALAVTSPDHENLAITGATPTTGDVTITGTAGGLLLFPPRPTHWTVTDAAADTAFTIEVIDDDTRSLTGSVARVSTGEALATISVDRSGTGTIAYADGGSSAVTSWTLAG